MDPNPDSGDTTPASPAANDPGTQPDPNQPANGSEPENNSGKEAMVPSHRLREETDARRAAERRAEEAEAKIKASETQPSKGEELDPDVEKLFDSYAKNKGLLTRAEFAKQQQEATAKIQVKQDVSELKSQYKDSGVPFDDQAVFDYMKDHGIPVTSKDSLDAAYLQMNRSKILEGERNKAIADFKEGGKSSAEKPDAGGNKQPSSPKAKGLRERIHASVQAHKQATA